jgi:hypothetical protein
MKVQEANKHMRDQYSDAFEHLEKDVQLPSALRTIVASGLTDRGNGIFLKTLLNKAQVSREDFPDDTGYECFVNLVHLEDFVEKDRMAIAISFLNEISKLILDHYPDRSFQGIISIDEQTCTVRFHAIRSGERWLSNKLDDYQEGVCVIDL